MKRTDRRWVCYSGYRTHAGFPIGTQREGPTLERGGEPPYSMPHLHMSARLWQNPSPLMQRFCPPPQALVGWQASWCMALQGVRKLGFAQWSKKYTRSGNQPSVSVHSPRPRRR